MTDALIGHTGFVGSNLFATFNSKNIGEIRGRSFGRVICAGVPALKWWANANAEEDWKSIERLIDDLNKIDASQFTLISTVDVYRNPHDVDEAVIPTTDGLHAYGVNRLGLEQFVAQRFPRHTIVRLPALIGRGLKKNVIYDLLNDNQLDRIHPESAFQWYPLDRLSDDLTAAEAANLRVVNFATEPVSMREIRDQFFPDKEIGSAAKEPVHYDVRTQYVESGYMLDRTQVMDAFASFMRRQS